MITRKDLSKFISISIVTFTMAFVCSGFLNMFLDTKDLRNSISDITFLKQIDTGLQMIKITFLITFIMLGITSLFMVISAIKSYITQKKKVMRMLAALGYSRIKISSGFYKFGLLVFLSLTLGYGLSMAISPVLYQSMNEDLEVLVTFQYLTVVIIIILPSIIISAISIFTSYFTISKRPLDMILEVENYKGYKKLEQYQKKTHEDDYLKQFSKIVLKTQKKTSLLIGFASFCFSAMLQMPITFSGSGFTLVGSVIMVISAVTLGCGILYIAVDIALKSNQRQIAIMKMYGYEDSVIKKVFLNRYQYIGYIGFIIGTIYQYLLVLFMMELYNKNSLGFKFDVVFRFDGLILVLVLFYLYYGLLSFMFRNKIKKMSYNELLKD